jgi:hypothetical protein
MPVVRLVTQHYFKDIVALGTEITSARQSGRTSTVLVQLYVGDALATELTMEVSSLYIVAFRGVDRVYSADEFGGENYNQLGMPTTLSLSDLRELVKLGQYRKGIALDTSLIAIAAVVVAEATRFQAVHMHIQGLLSGIFTNIPLKELDKQYFKNWSKTSDSIRSGAFTPGPQIVVDVLCAPTSKTKK